MRSFDFSYGAFDFRSLSRLIAQTTLLISNMHAFVAFDFSNDTFLKPPFFDPSQYTSFRFVSFRRIE